MGQGESKKLGGAETEPRIGFSCPTIDGLKLTDESQIPTDKSVEGRTPDGPVEDQNAYDIYRKLILGLHSAGYQLKRYGAAFGLLLNNSHISTALSESQQSTEMKLQDIFTQKAHELMGLGILSGGTEARIRLGQKQLFEIYDPLADFNDQDFSLLLSPHELRDTWARKADSVEFLIDFVSDGTTGQSEGLRYYLHDWLTSCTYTSETYFPKDDSLPAERIIDDMLHTAKIYLEAVPLETAISAARSISSPWTDAFQLYSLDDSFTGKTGWQELVDTFDEVTICASNYVNHGFDLMYGSIHIDAGAPAMSSCPNEIVIDEEVLKQTMGAPIVIRGGLEALSTLAATDIRTAQCFELGEGLEKMPDDFVRGIEGAAAYRYLDRYGNTIIAVTFEHWTRPFKCPGDDAYLMGMLIYPRIFFTDSSDSTHQIDLDLSPIGLGEYKNLAKVRGLPHVFQVNEELDIYSDEFSADDFSDEFKMNMERGINLAMALFEEEDAVSKVIVRRTKLPNAAAKLLQKGVIYILGQDPNELTKGSLGWIVAAHESLHVIDGLYSISTDSEFVALYQGLQPTAPAQVSEDGMVSAEDLLRELFKEPHPFMEVIAESSWLKLEKGGHPWDHEREFFVSLCLSLMHENITEKFRSLPPEHQILYIRSLEVLKGAIDRKVPKAPNLTMSRRIANTLEILKPIQSCTKNSQTSTP